MPAGVRIGCRTASVRLVLTLRTERDCSPVDAVVDGVHVARRSPTPSGRVVLELGPTTVAREVWLWLPQYGQVEVVSVEVEEAERCDAPHINQRRWVTYGSSITQGRQADGPLDTWPARISRRLGLDLTSMGFGGQCLLDPMVARTIAGLPASVVSVCLGINIFGQASHDQRTLLPAVLGFLTKVRDGHPGIPLVVITPLATRRPATERNAVGMTLSEVGRDIAEAARLLSVAGDDRIRVVPGHDLLGPQDTHTLVDDVHPGSAGHALIGARLGSILGDLISDQARS